MPVLAKKGDEMNTLGILCPPGSEIRQSTRANLFDAYQSHNTTSAKSLHLPAEWHLARFPAAGFCSRVSVLDRLLSAVGYKCHALNHFLNCHGLPQRLAFALRFHVPRKCLQCAWHKPSPHVSSCDGHSAGARFWFQLVSSCSGCFSSF